MKDRAFCERLAELRKLKNLTHAELAERCELNTAGICYYESGEWSPGLATIRALCKGLECTASELLGA